MGCHSCDDSQLSTNLVPGKDACMDLLIRMLYSDKYKRQKKLLKWLEVFRGKPNLQAQYKRKVGES